MRWLRGVSVCADMTITNNQQTPQCYKIKCTDNALFRVRPPMNFIAPGASAIVKVLHTSHALPDHNKHYFAIYHIKCTKEDMRAKNFKRVWRVDSHADGVMRMPVCFETPELRIGTPSSSSSASAASPLMTVPDKHPIRPITMSPGVGSMAGPRKSMKRKPDSAEQK
ncbi:hypothetical protein PFISCL1PPCAC_17535 [Pristionchus fissidentatus]|uniref:Major sperm protein n=1 Tax=Pristionchus fissidentatus TaxID=1538716 RepID=A0AAV5W3U3_9BILA|nr:hypothetical protein PFISCL1PPCAC_17535 [Pristionchus fissidentatus]